MWMTGNIGWVNSAFWLLDVINAVAGGSGPTIQSLRRTRRMKSVCPGQQPVQSQSHITHMQACTHTHTHTLVHTQTDKDTQWCRLLEMSVRQPHSFQFLLLQVSIQLITKSTDPTVYHAEVLLNPSEWWKGCWESYQQPLLSKSAVYLKLEIFSVDYKNILKLHYLLVQLDEINYKQSPLDKLFSLTSLISWNIQMKRICSSRHSHSQAYRFGIGLWESGTNPSNRQLLHVCLNQTPF